MPISPQEFLDGLYDGLGSRTRATFRIAHTLLDDDGYHILDLNIHAPSLAEAERQMLDLLPTLDPDAPLPHATKELWEKFLLSKNVERKIIPTPLGRRGLIGVYVRGR